MRIRILITGLILAVAVFACMTADQHTSLVTNDGFVPYYTDLAEAQAAAGDQYLVVDFWSGT